jgi:oligoribonuclease NrnB/cAMP/cGMP phosphodiesterase (DHH superfamily)
MPEMTGKQGLCIYHKNCADGFAAALTVWLKYGDRWDYRAAQHGDEPPEVTGRDVLIVDFSYPRRQLEALRHAANCLTVIDHHKTAADDLTGLDYCIFDMHKSGAVLTWEYLFPNRPVPLLLQYVQDRDLWQWKLPSSKAVSAALRLTPTTFPAWQALLMDDRLADLANMGEILLQYQMGCVEAATNKAVGTLELEGYTVPCINCTHLVSDIVSALSEHAPFAVGYFDTKDRRVFSLRSGPGGVDVAEIAKKRGGGGHAHAASFWIPLPRLL